MSKKKKEPVEPTTPVAEEAEAQEAAAESAEEWRDRYLRALAELDNYRKRAEREREIARTYATEGLVREVLPVLDDLDAALTVEGDLDAIREGVGLALRELTNALEAKGMKAIEAVGQPFDPRVHEAVGVKPADEGQATGTIVEEERRGYMLHDRVLRPSRVHIAVQPPAPANDEGEEED